MKQNDLPTITYTGDYEFKNGSHIASDQYKGYRSAVDLIHMLACSMGGEMPSPTQQIKSEELIDDLTYFNYAHNRNLSPHITPESWAKVYGQRTPAMEERYQREQGKVSA